MYLRTTCLGSLVSSEEQNMAMIHGFDMAKLLELPNIGKGKEYDEGQEITQAFELEVNAP